MSPIGKRLKEMGRSQGWLALQCGVERTYINKLCTGKIQDPRTSTAIALARVLKCSVESLWKF